MQLCALSLDAGGDSTAVDSCRSALYNSHENRCVAVAAAPSSRLPALFFCNTFSRAPPPPPLQMLRHLHQSCSERNGGDQRELGARVGRWPHDDARDAAAAVIRARTSARCPRSWRGGGDASSICADPPPACCYCSIGGCRCCIAVVIVVVIIIIIIIIGIVITLLTFCRKGNEPKTVDRYPPGDV